MSNNQNKSNLPKNQGSSDKGMCDAKPPMLDEFLTYPPEYSDRDWKEDFSHENGNYACKCSAGCGKMFYGHKRRVLCRTCAIPKPICGENCGCTGPEDCYGEAGLNLVEKLANENAKPLVDVVENTNTVSSCSEKPNNSNEGVENKETVEDEALKILWCKAGDMNYPNFKKWHEDSWQQSQSIEGIVGFVLEWVLREGYVNHASDRKLLMAKKSDIIKLYQDGK